MHDNVLNQLQQYKAAITEQLEKVIKDKQAGFAIVNEWGSDTLDRLLEFSKNGKMIRGALLLCGTEMFGRKITAEHLKAATALELIQSAILIHDDIIFFLRPAFEIAYAWQVYPFSARPGQLYHRESVWLIG